MNHGIELADGSFMEGSCGESNNILELTMSNEDAIRHITDFMNPEKTKVIKFVVNSPIAVYEGYTQFLSMRPDSVPGRMDIFLQKI